MCGHGLIPGTIGTYCGYRHLVNGKCPTSFIPFDIILQLDVVTGFPVKHLHTHIDEALGVATASH